MNKHAKLALLLSAAWFVIDLTLFVTGSLSGDEIAAFWAYLFAGIALINLSIWGYRWISSSAG
jgi:hypothetical protein